MWSLTRLETTIAFLTLNRDRKMKSMKSKESEEWRTENGKRKQDEIILFYFQIHLHL